MRIPGFVGASYSSHSPSVDTQRTVNWIPERNESGAGKAGEVLSFRRTPGLRLLDTLGLTPGRGLYTASNGRCFGVWGSTLYEVSATARTSRGTINTSSGKVRFADDGITLLFVDGADGWLLNFETNALTVISDEDFPVAPNICGFWDGYFIVGQAGTGNFQISSLYAGAEWDGLDFANAESSPDPVVDFLIDHGEGIFAGTQSIEGWFNSGDADFPFARIQGARADIGLAGDTLRNVDSTPYMGIQTKDGGGSIFRIQGYSPQRISTHAIEKIIADQGGLSNATAWTYQMDGHSFYCVNLPTVTICFDASTGLWHERQHTTGEGVTSRHRAEHHAYVDGLHLVSDYENGNLYVMENETLGDGTAGFRLRRFPHISQDMKRISHGALKVDMATGVGNANVPDPLASLRVSRDGGYSWGNEKTSRIGRAGERKPHGVWFRRLGQARDWVFELSVPDQIDTALVSAYFEGQLGTS